MDYKGVGSKMLYITYLKNKTKCSTKYSMSLHFMIHEEFDTIDNRV